MFPNPSPLFAPLTNPAISMNSTVAGITFSGLYMFLSFSYLSSGRFTMPTWGSIVQKGKFSAGAFDFVSALNRVDLPTLGSPTIPHCNDI